MFESYETFATGLLCAISLILQMISKMWQMTKTVKRPKLDIKQIQQCHEIVDELVKLHQETDPKHGAESETDKQEMALQALNKLGVLTGILTEWAECQIFGAYYHVAKSEKQWIDEEASNKHENELMWYGNNIPDDVFSNDCHLICERLAIGKILHNSFSHYGRMGWRLALEQSLYALNEGQVDWLVTPANKGKKGDAFDLQELKWIAIQHLYKLIGQGIKKMAAESYVADACGVTVDAIKKWEKECVKERDKDKSTLNSIKLGSVFIKVERQENPEFSEDTILSTAMVWNMNAEKSGDKGHLKNLSFGIISVIMLDRENPLETMAEKLFIAGLRQSGTK